MMHADGKFTDITGFNNQMWVDLDLFYKPMSVNDMLWFSCWGTVNMIKLGG